MYSQSTYKEPLFCSSWFALCSSAERQLVWELVMGFSIVFKRQRTTNMLTSRDTTVIRHRKSHSKGHRLRSDTWLQWLPLQGHHQAVASDRTDVKGKCCQSEASSLTSSSVKGNRLRGQGADLLSHWAGQRPAFAHPAQGRLHSLLCSPGRHPSYCQGACGLERVRG